jgi:hypothetical protein
LTVMVPSSEWLRRIAQVQSQNGPDADQHCRR